MGMSVRLSPHPHQYFFYLYIFYNSHLDRWGDMAVWFAFPWWLVIMSIISRASWPSVCLWKNMYSYPLSILASFVAQLVRKPSAMQETWVQSLGWEDPLEKGKGTHSSILAWRMSWTIEYTGSQRVGHNWTTFTFIKCFSICVLFHFFPQCQSF